MDVTLTDYAVTAECAYFTYLLIPARSPISHLAAAFIIFFLSIAVAATAGGTVHGFFADEKSFGHRLLWPFTLFCVGITAFAGIHISAALLFSSAAIRLIDIAGVLVFLAYTVVILFVRSDFRLAVLNYLPSLIFLASAFLIVHLRSGKSALLVGFLGICVMIAAAGAQQLKWALHSRFFNHNAVYHVLQALALWMIFIAAQESIRLEEYTR